MVDEKYSLKIPNLEQITTEEAITRGLIPIGTPILVKGKLKIRGKKTTYTVMDVPEPQKIDLENVKAYVQGNPDFTIHIYRGFHAIFPVQFYTKDPKYKNKF